MVGLLIDLAYPPVLMTRSKKSAFKCSICRKAVQEGSYSLGCEFDGCDTWFHIHCLGITVAEHDRLVNEGEEWFCELCGLKNNKVLLSEEIKNLTQTITILQSDLKDMQVSCDQLRKQIISLSEICLKKEEEIANLNSDFDSYMNSNGINGMVSNKEVPSGFDASRFTSDFPPLNVSNRYSLLSIDDDELEVDLPIPIRRSKRAATGSAKCLSPSRMDQQPDRSRRQHGTRSPLYGSSSWPIGRQTRRGQGALTPTRRGQEDGPTGTKQGTRVINLNKNRPIIHCQKHGKI